MAIGPEKIVGRQALEIRADKLSHAIQTSEGAAAACGANATLEIENPMERLGSLVSLGASRFLDRITLPLLRLHLGRVTSLLSTQAELERATKSWEELSGHPMIKDLEAQMASEYLRRLQEKVNGLQDQELKHFDPKNLPHRQLQRYEENQWRRTLNSLLGGEVKPADQSTPLPRETEAVLPEEKKPRYTKEYVQQLLGPRYEELSVAMITAWLNATEETALTDRELSEEVFSRALRTDKIEAWEVGRLTQGKVTLLGRALARKGIKLFSVEPKPGGRVRRYAEIVSAVPQEAIAEQVQPQKQEVGGQANEQPDNTVSQTRATSSPVPVTAYRRVEYEIPEHRVRTLEQTLILGTVLHLLSSKTLKYEPLMRQLFKAENRPVLPEAWVKNRELPLNGVRDIFAQSLDNLIWESGWELFTRSQEEGGRWTDEDRKIWEKFNSLLARYGDKETLMKAVNAGFARMIQDARKRRV